MSRQITRLAIENIPDFLDYESNSEAIVKALRISGVMELGVDYRRGWRVAGAVVG